MKLHQECLNISVSCNVGVIMEFAKNKNRWFPSFPSNVYFRNTVLMIDDHKMISDLFPNFDQEILISCQSVFSGE